MNIRFPIPPTWILLAGAMAAAQAEPVLTEYSAGAAVSITVTDRDGVVAVGQDDHSVGCSWRQAQQCDLRYLIDVVKVADAGAELGQGRAEAEQNMVGGYAHDIRSGFQNYDGRVASVEVRADTVYRVAMTEARGDTTSLVAEFIWLPSTIDLRAHYGVARVKGSLSVGIYVSRNGQPEQLVWGFDDILGLDPAQPWVLQQTEVDPMGVGMPATRRAEGWEAFERFATVERLAFRGELNLGDTLPGESFSLSYRASSSLSLSDVSYAAATHLRLSDPLQLTGTPRLGLRGVAFGSDAEPASVPVPATPALVAVALLAALRRPGRARPAPAGHRS